MASSHEQNWSSEIFLSDPFRPRKVPPLLLHLSSNVFYLIQMIFRAHIYKLFIFMIIANTVGLFIGPPKRSLPRPWFPRDVFIRNKHRKPDSIRVRRGWWQRGWIFLVGHSVAKQGTVNICFEFLVEYCECRRNWVQDTPPPKKIVCRGSLIGNVTMVCCQRHPSQVQ